MRDAASALGVDPYTWVLTGGDDHPMVATFPPTVELPEGWRAIGRVLDGSGFGRSAAPREIQADCHSPECVARDIAENRHAIDALDLSDCQLERC